MAIIKSLQVADSLLKTKSSTTIVTDAEDKFEIAGLLSSRIENQTPVFTDTGVTLEPCDDLNYMGFQFVQDVFYAISASKDTLDMVKNAEIHNIKYRDLVYYVQVAQLLESGIISEMFNDFETNLHLGIDEYANYFSLSELDAKVMEGISLLMTEGMAKFLYYEGMVYIVEPKHRDTDLDLEETFKRDFALPWSLMNNGGESARKMMEKLYPNLRPKDTPNEMVGV